MIEKLGVSQAQLKEELTKELTGLMEKRNTLSKTAAIQKTAAEAKAETQIEDQISQVKERLNAIHGE